MSGHSSSSQGRWPVVLSILFVGMASTVLATFGLESAGTEARAHPATAGMLRAGAAPDPRLAWLAWGFGALVLSAFVALLLVSTTRRAHAPGSLWLLLIAVVIQLAFAGVMLSWREGVGGGGGPGVPSWGPFPPATNWMLLAFYPCQLLLVVHLLLGFRRWYWTADDEQRFERLLDDERAHAGPE